MNWFRSQGNKYGNKRTPCGQGHSHRSGLESSVCDMLELRKKAGEFTEVEIEKHVKICGKPGHACASKIESVVDFRCTRSDGSLLYVEAKGMATDLWGAKKRLWAHYGPAPLEIWVGNSKGLKLQEVLDPCQD